MADKIDETPDLAKLTAEVCDLWQEHLNNLATDPSAHTDLLRMMEPQRRMFASLFADYTAMMQTGGHANGAASPQPSATAGTASAGPSGFAATGPLRPIRPTADPDSAAESAQRPASAAAAFDDSALRLAQLAYRMAALERRVEQLEQHTSPTDAVDASAAKTARPARKSEPDGGNQ